MGEPLGRVLGAEPERAGERAGDRLEAGVGDAGEEAGAATGDGEVGDVADAAVEDGAGGPLAAARGSAAAASSLGEGADHREGGEVDPDRLEPGAADRLEEGGDHVAAGGDDDHVDLRRLALLGRHAADHLVLEHRLVERHRHLLLGLEADRRLHFLRVLDRGQPHGADDDPLVADAEPHLLARACARRRAPSARRRGGRRRAPRPRGRCPGRAGRSPRRPPATEPLLAPRSRRCCRPRCRGRRRCSSSAW